MVFRALCFSHTGFGSGWAVDKTNVMQLRHEVLPNNPVGEKFEGVPGTYVDVSVGAVTAARTGAGTVFIPRDTSVSSPLGRDWQTLGPENFESLYVPYGPMLNLHRERLRARLNFQRWKAAAMESKALGC